MTVERDRFTCERELCLCHILRIAVEKLSLLNFEDKVKLRQTSVRVGRCSSQVAIFIHLIPLVGFSGYKQGYDLLLQCTQSL